MCCGRCQVLRLDPASAVKTYKRALAVDPCLPNVWFNLANAHLKLEEEEEAAQWQVSLSVIGSDKVNEELVLAPMLALFFTVGDIDWPACCAASLCVWRCVRWCDSAAVAPEEGACVQADAQRGVYSVDFMIRVDLTGRFGFVRPRCMRYNS